MINKPGLEPYLQCSTACIYAEFEILTAVTVNGM
jgi:hypothetical protein